MKPVENAAKEEAKSAPAKKPAKKAEKPAAEKKPAPAKKMAEEKDENASPYSGKWIFRTVNGKYVFELRASNGEKMLTSGEYSSLSGARNGLKTYKSNIEKGNFRIIQTKMGDFIFQLLNANGQLLSLGADYKTRTRCENAIESTKHFAVTASVEIAEEE